MRKKILLPLLALVLTFLAAPAFADYYTPGFTLQNNSQCVGGTLVTSYADVQDTGADIAAKSLATLDCQWLMTGPGQCCDVDYRRVIAPPPAIGFHYFNYKIYAGATITSETPPPDWTGPSTLPALQQPTTVYQRWAGIGGPVQCTGTWQVESTDLSDASCPISTNVNNLPGIYSAVPTCSSSNPEGTACSSGGVCKRNVLTSMSGCVIETTIYSCTAPNGSAISSSCAQNSCTPETYADQWYTGTINQTNVFNERLGSNYDCSLWAQSEGFTHWNQSTIYRAGEYDPYDVVCTGFIGTPTGTVAKPRVTNILGTATGAYHEFRSGKVCPGITPPTASIVANPNSIVRGEQSMLTWSSTNANSCTGTNFNTEGATSGSVMVSPSATTQYSVSCTGAGGTGNAQATVTVVEPNTPTQLSISCRAAPTNVAVGQEVIWSSSVSGPSGLYYYSWSGTENLSGSANTVTKAYTSEGAKSAWLTITFKPQDDLVINSPSSGGDSGSNTSGGGTDGSGSTGGNTSGGGTTEGNILQLPRGSACPAIGFAMPITPCDGTWAPAYDANGCQSGWQCVSGGGGGGLLGPQETTFLDTLQNFLNFESPVVQRIPDVESVNGEVLGTSTGTSSGQCGVGQTPVLNFNVSGASCSGGTEIGRITEMLDGSQIGMWPVGWVAEQCAGLGAENGDCCEYSQQASNVIGGGFPPNSYYQFRVVRGGTFSESESDFTKARRCSPFNLGYSCSSVAGEVGVQCVGGPGGGGETIVKTVQCENSVNVGARKYQCSDGIDNDGDGKIDHPSDPGCDSPQDDDERDGGNSQCSDGVDNDGDGRIDQNDSGCVGSGGYDPNDDSEGGGAPQCSDGRDNDGDGNVDYPDDLGCSSANDNDESSDAGILQLTIAPSLIKKGQSCTLTVSATSVQSCSLTGPGVSRTLTPTQGNISTSVTTPAMTQSGKYTLSCVGIDGRTVTKTADCRVAPSFEEF